MTTLHVGAVIERPPGPKYHAALDFAELSPRPPLPKPKTLAKIPESLPGGFALSLSAPRSCFVSERGPLRLDDALGERIGWLAQAVTAVQAKAIVIPTLGEVRTGPKDRARLEDYFSALREKTGGTPLVWEPGGLWEAEEAAQLATKMEVALAFDPLDVDESFVGSSPITYFRIRGMGARTRLGEGALSMVVDAVERHDDAETIFIAIESQRSVREATRLKQLLAGD